ncbi:MAG TPA: extracellular solute-binding protein [Chloroflexota bacterium]|nr:extracellular solute-binding protein [Chloroflexota bacterium]
MRRRVLLGLAGAGTLTPLLAACGGPASGRGDVAAGVSQLPKEPMQLTYITWVGAAQVKLMQQAADVVRERHPNIRTEVQSIPQAEMILKPTTMAAAGMPPDILHTNDKQVIDSIARNLFSDLNPLLNRDKAAVNLEDFYPVYVNGMKWQNKLLALPDFTGTSVMYYNKKLFDEANLKYPDNEWTWEDLETAGRRLLQRYPEGSNTFIIQPFAEDIRHFPYLAWSYGGSMIEGSGLIPPDKTVVKVYSPQNIKQWQRYVDWITKLHIIARPGEPSEWNNQKQATDLRTRDSVPGYLALDWMKEHGAMALPPKGTSPRRTRATTRASAIPPEVRNRDASWEVVKFMTGKEGLEITMAGGYTQPVRKSVEPAFQKTLQPFESFQVYMDSQKAYGEGVPYHAQWIELEPVVKEHIQRAVKGETTVDQALKDLQTAMELRLKTATETFTK